MGSCLVGYALAIDKGVTPKFFKIYPNDPHVFKYIEFQEQINGNSDYSKEHVAESLNMAMERLADAWADTYNDTIKYAFSKQTVLFTGGDSWGDSPTETFDAIDILYQADLLKEIGFEF